MSAASEVAVRRIGAPRSPRRSVSGGSQSANAVAPRGAVSSVTAVTSSPVRRPAVRAGSAVVAEASTKTGDEPYRAQIRRSRRSTWATWEPKTPR
jgi:hypothetical protein